MIIRDAQYWHRWEAEWQRRTPADPETNFRIFWTLLEMARAAGAWPPEDPLEGLEVDIRLAYAINHGRLHESGKSSHGDTENTET